ncbi:MAG: 5-formyltetrahydrofolate cyclo-ligase [Lachnospiraceae bacterium]|nr:5-formyltetrahydrofolate cyclo-ligase [Lachnospiraceae bacterium]
MQEKKEVRKMIKQFRDAATDAEVAAMSSKAADFIVSIPEYQKAECVYAYIDYNHEVMTDEIISRAWEAGKRVAVPKVVGKDLIWYYITKFEDVESGYMGIREPKTTLPEAHETDAFFVMPGVAFDKGHHRVGYGGGFYDRYLEKPNTHYKAALAFEFQILDAVPFEAHDILPDAIVSEKAIY